MLKKELNAACDYTMSDQTMESFLGLATEVRLKNKDVLIPHGKLDSNVYVIGEGIIRLAYFEGLQEKTFAFYTRGNLLISYHSFYMNVPSFFQYESCCNTVLLKISKAKIDGLLSQSVDFKNWMLRMSLEQLWCWEMKVSVINGTARERFETLLKVRPEILQKVSSKIVASYIGIIPSSLSRLKRQLTTGRNE